MIENKIQVTNLNKSFINKSTGEDIIALQDINFNVMPNEFLAILGPSGCGKTTLLRIIQGLETPTSGSILINGQSENKESNSKGFVFQEYGLLPWRTVSKNVEYGLEVKGKSKSKRRDIADYYIKLVGLEGFENNYPHQLSGGMQQRVGLARAMAIEPEFILLDEPFGALDALTREVLQQELAKLTNQMDKTILFVTHSVDEALYLADRIMILEPRPGKIREIIINDYEKPKIEYGNKLKTLKKFTDRREYILDILMEETSVTSD